MNSLTILFAGIALAAAYGLRAPSRSGRIAAILAFLVGLAVTVLAVRGLASLSGLGRTTDFDRVVNAAVERAASDPDAPIMIFSGASYSRNAIDDIRLTQGLRERGLPHLVINLSLEAASLPEREAHLLDFLERSGRVPDVVFIEIAEAFDHQPAQFFNNSKFSARGIEQFDLRTSAWTAFGLAQGGCNGAADCVKSVGLTGAHFLLNALNVGLVARGEQPSAAGTLSAYDPQSEPREDIHADDRASGLTGVASMAPRAGPVWVASLRGILENRLIQLGVGQVGYYFPPVIPKGERAYAAGLCLGELAHAPCIPPVDTALLAALDGPVWLDEHHLLTEGANTYTDWLAERMPTLLAPAPAGPAVGAEAAQ